jgi:hypothetical protein
LAIQPRPSKTLGVPPDRTAGSLCETIDDSIRSIRGGEEAVDKINLAKLF